MKILIGGDDETAFRLARILMEDHSVVLICSEETKDSIPDQLDVDRVIGNVTSWDILMQAGANKAALFVACTPSDERNLVACVSAKRAGARRATCFLLRRDVRSTEKDAEALGRQLGIDTVILPAERLAREILRIVTVPGALEVEAFEGGQVRLVRRAVEEDTLIAQGTLKEVGIPAGVVLVMARRGEEAFIPNGSTHLQPGDQITAMGNMGGINRLIYKWLRPASARGRARRATVIGGGLVGFDVAKGLGDAGWEVKVVDADRARCEEISPLLPKALVLHFDGTNLDRLQEEDVGESSVLIAVTSNDEKNLMVSLLAKHLGVPRIVTRADKSSNERLFEKVGIDVVRSARGAAISSVARGIVASQTDLMAELEHGDVVVLRLEVPAHRPPTSLSKMRAPVFAIIGAILREGKVIIPHGDDEVAGGDRLLVFTKREDEDTARHYFQRFEL